jgi:hypothetical protein
MRCLRHKNLHSPFSRNSGDGLRAFSIEAQEAENAVTALLAQR